MKGLRWRHFSAFSILKEIETLSNRRRKFVVKTSRCPYCAFGFHCKFRGMRSLKLCHSCQIMSFMSNHVIHVKSRHSSQIMLFMLNHVIHVISCNLVKSCHACQIMSFMSNHVIHLKSCHSSQIMQFMSKHVIHVKSCH
jgi:hypothetical protein